jgi:hypothetical protein
MEMFSIQTSAARLVLDKVFRGKEGFVFTQTVIASSLHIEQYRQHLLPKTSQHFPTSIQFISCDIFY